MTEPIRKTGKKALFREKGSEIVIGEKERRIDEGVDPQLRELLEAMEAVRKGDLTKKLKKEGEDIFSELAESYNEMVNLLNLFSGEVTRVSREMGPEGLLRVQAKV